MSLLMEQVMEDRRSRSRYTPTPEEIQEECLKIREGWSKERWARERGPTPWSIPIISSAKKNLPPHD